MVFAGASVIAGGKLVEGSITPTFNAGATSGYHLLVIQGHSRTVLPVNHSIASHTFTVGGHPWCIQYYPNGFWPNDHGLMVSFLLQLKHATVKPVMVQFEFSFVDETEKHGHVRETRQICAFLGFVLANGYTRFITREALEKSMYLKHDSFTIRCDVVVTAEGVTSPCIEVPRSEMKQNFTDLLLAGEGTDVVFQVGGETVAAHRAVLAARSAVFKASLFGPMKEGSTSTVVRIDDMDATVFKAMLRFIYGDSMPEPADDDNAVLFQHLFVAADKYGLGRLKAMCENKLCNNIGVSTAMTILALAEQHQCYGLKEACYRFLSCPENMKAVLATDGFDYLCRSCPPVMKDLMMRMLQAPK